MTREQLGIFGKPNFDRICLVEPRWIPDTEAEQQKNEASSLRVPREHVLLRLDHVQVQYVLWQSLILLRSGSLDELGLTWETLPKPQRSRGGQESIKQTRYSLRVREVYTAIGCLEASGVERRSRGSHSRRFVLGKRNEDAALSTRIVCRDDSAASRAVGNL